MSVLSLKALSISKPKAPTELLVDTVNCTIDAGEILAIIGPNGAGKSSLLKAISGDWPYTGEIQTPNISNHAKLRARQLATLPQFSLLNFPFKVTEVVLLGRIPHATGITIDRQIVDEALQLMGISFLQNRRYTELSGGEKQRVQLARVLAQIWDPDDAHNETRLLLLDEPTTALDLGHQHALMNAVTGFAKRGVAIIMVLHNINLAARYADKILALLCSQTVGYGTAEEVITPSNIKCLFGIDVEIMKSPINQSPIVLGL